MKLNTSLEIGSCRRCYRSEAWIVRGEYLCERCYIKQEAKRAIELAGVEKAINEPPKIVS